MNKKFRPSLADSLIGVVPKPATPQPSTISRKLIRAQQLIQELFGDTRQQYQEALNPTYTNSEEQQAERRQKRGLIASVMGVGLATAGVLAAPIFYVPSAICSLYVAWYFIEDAYRVYTEEGHLDYRTILAIMIPAALVGGFIWAAAFGYLLGMTNWFLAAKTENRSKRAIAELFGGQIHTVWLLVEGIEVKTALDKVQEGDIVVVHAGQMIPVDGTIIAGTATIDQHRLTGESQPVEKGVEDAVLASTVALSGQLHICVEKAGNRTVAGQVTTMLNQTTDFKRTLQSRTDRWLNRISLPVLGLSALSLPLVGAAGAVSILWYYPGIRMIVFGPISMLSYLQVAAQRGILVKDGRALEVLDEIDTVVFDKTGTLTLELPTVSGLFSYNGFDEIEVLRYAAAAETKQSHPIAQAILQAATERDLDLPALEDVEYKVGYGLKVQIAGSLTLIGSLRFMEAEKLPIPEELTTQQAASHAQGSSLVFVAVDHTIVGAIELQPAIRPEAEEIISHLHDRNIETVIISGDSEVPTRRLAHKLGIDRYFAEVLPKDKADLVTELKEEGHKVCFIGDGINDSIALKTADVAISLHGATTIATDMAEIVFMDGTLRQLPTLFELADDFTGNMHTNMLASTLPGVVGIAGTLLFGWGMGVCLLLTQLSTPIGLYNSLKPLLDERKSQEKALLN